MAANDVKVTLTADDQATEIVRRLASAVKQLDAQQRTANQSVSAAQSAASGAAGAFASFQKAIAGVAAALGAIRIVEFVRDTIEATDEIGKLAQKTGASTEALSILAVAASTADLSQQELGDGLKFLSRSLTELNGNVPKAVEAFGALGLSAKDLKGLSLDQVLVKVANAQEKFGDGAGKAAALMQIFGRNGTALIPLLHDLSNGGFDQAAQKAKDLGLVVGGDAAKAAQDFDDALTTLKNSLKGVVIAFTPLVKQIADLTTKVAEFVSQHQNIVAIAGALSLLAGAISTLTIAIAGFKAIGAGALIARFAAFLVGGPIGAAIGAVLTLATAFGIVKAHIDAVNESAAKAAKGNLDKLIQDVGLKDAKKPDVTLPDSAQKKALIDAQLAAAKQGAKDELSATQAGLGLIQEIENEHFAQGLTSLREFYAQKVQITKQGVNAQIAELEAQKQALTASPLPENTPAAQIQRTTELKSLDQQIANLRVSGQQQVLALLEEERQKRIQIADTVRSFNAKILSAQGQQAQADQIAITKQVNDFILALKAEGKSSTDQINAQAAALKNVLTLQSQFTALQTRANQEQSSLDLARQAVQVRVQQGLISERQGQLDIAEIERQRLPTLENLADQMLKVAVTPEQIQAAQQFKAQFEGIGKVVDQSTIKLANLKDTLFSNAQLELSNFLGSTISQVHSLSEAFADLAAAIIGSFQRVTADLLASAAIDKLRHLFDHPTPPPVQQTGEAVAAAANKSAGTAMETASVGMVSAGKTMAGAAAAMLLAAQEMAAATGSQFAAAALSGQFLAGFASGGPIVGPGTGTSDSILARVSHGEYVIRADAVKRWGVGFFDALNGLQMPSLIRPKVGGLPAFATGGFVSASPSSATVSGGVDITVGVDDGAVIKAFSTRGGVKALQKIVGNNPQAFKAALGIA